MRNRLSIISFSIRHITVPMLVLHAEDDWMVSHSMGHKVCDDFEMPDCSLVV